jgi:D-3-phosphoglycerate dehydrogenase / 2-oxoglutarate reductase
MPGSLRDSPTRVESMVVLGSAYRGVTKRLRDCLGSDYEVRDFDATRPVEEQIGDVDALLLGSLQVTERVLESAPRLRLIHQHGRGVDGVDLEAAAARGVWVANVPQGNSVAVAEHALGLVFVLAKHLHRASDYLARRELGAPITSELAGASLGILGLGAAGGELAVRAKALGMRVLAVKSTPSSCSVSSSLDFLGGPEATDRVLEEADFVVIALPLSQSTRGLIARDALARMKRTACLVNIARAQVVDYADLFEALQHDHIAGAAFDVFWSEPADIDDPMLKLPNFVLTPHQAGFSNVSVDAVARVIADNLRRLAEGRPLQNAVVQGRLGATTAG